MAKLAAARKFSPGESMPAECGNAVKNPLILRSRGLQILWELWSSVQFQPQCPCSIQRHASKEIQTVFRSCGEGVCRPRFGDDARAQNSGADPRQSAAC